MSVAPQNSYVAILTPNVMVLGGRACGVIRSWQWSSHEWDECPYKRDPREFSCPFHHERTQWEDGHLWSRRQELTRPESAGTLLLDFPASRTVRKECLWFKPPNVWYFCYSSLNRLGHWVSQMSFHGTSLVAQWLRICLPVQGTQVRSLVQEDPTCCRATKPVSHNYWSRAP